MIPITFTIFVIISYICLALTTSAILNLDIGNTLSKAELLIYKNEIIHLLATFALMYSLTKNIALSVITIVIYTMLKYIPTKTTIKCKKNKSSNCEKYKRDKVVTLL
jgi:hypothetical protein